MLPYSQASENNKEPISAVLADVFADTTRVLEIASGTGQHAVHLGRLFPHLTWQPSDLADKLDGIRARLELEATDNVMAPVELDVTADSWPVNFVDGIFSANCIHIISWDHVTHLFRGVGDVLLPGGALCLYGPFKYAGAFTTPSNADFDDWLKARDSRSGIRDFEAVDRLATEQGLTLENDFSMPANNQLIVWRRDGNTQP